MISSLIRIPSSSSSPFWSIGGRSTTTTTISSSSLTPRISTRRQQHHRPPAILLSSSYGQKKLSSCRRLEPPLLIPKSTTTTITDQQTDTEFLQALADYDRGLLPRTLINLLILSLTLHGVRVVFRDHNTSKDLTMSLDDDSSPIETVIQHESGSAFSGAMGYSRFSDGLPGVCLVSSLSCAQMESAKHRGIPVVAILPAFNAAAADTGTLAAAAAANRTYLVADVEDIPRIVRQAFASPCVGPVVIKIEEKLSVTNRRVISHKLEPILDIIADSRKPLIYIDKTELATSNAILKRFLELTGGIPVATHINYGNHNEKAILYDFHENVFKSFSPNICGDCVDYAVQESDLLLAFGIQLDDAYDINLTVLPGNKTVVHIVGIYPDCNKYIPWRQRKLLVIHSNVTLAIGEMVRLLEERKITASLRQSDLSAWRQELIYSFNEYEDEEEEEEVVVAAEEELVPLEPHHVTQFLSEYITGEAVISTGGIDHSETGAAAEFFRHIKPTQHAELSLAEAIGVAAARPDAVVVHIDGDGWYSPRITNQDFADIHFGQKIKVILLNYEDRDRAGTKSEYSDGKPDVRVTKRSELRAAIKYLLKLSWSGFTLEVVLPKHASFCGGGGGPSADEQILE